MLLLHVRVNINYPINLFPIFTQPGLMENKPMRVNETDHNTLITQLLEVEL